MLRKGYRVPFTFFPTLSRSPINLPSYSPNSIKGKALAQEIQALVKKRAVASSRITRVLQSSVRRPEVFGSLETHNRSRLNQHVEFALFHMKTPQSLLRSGRRGD